MKLSITATVITFMFVSSVLAAPIAEETVYLNSTNISKASITISKPTINPPPSATLADTMSGTTALASISIKGHDASYQSTSASESNFLVSTVLLPIIIASAMFVM